MRFAVVLAIVTGALTMVGLILVGLVWVAFILAAAAGALVLAAIWGRDDEPGSRRQSMDGARQPAYRLDP